jgi:hypothetical protein
VVEGRAKHIRPELIYGWRDLFTKDDKDGSQDEN